MGNELCIGPAQWLHDQEALKAIRFEVFVHEQQVPAEEEIDAEDPRARHWLAYLKGKPVGTARAVAKAPGLWKVGRVAVRKVARGKGVGAELMKAIARAAELEGVQELVLDAQNHAIPFYEGLGYVVEGEEFLDCQIPHHRMRQHLVAPQGQA